MTMTFKAKTGLMILSVGGAMILAKMIAGTIGTGDYPVLNALAIVGGVLLAVGFVFLWLVSAKEPPKPATASNKPLVAAHQSSPGSTGSIAITCEGCGSTYTLGVDAISMTAKELASMMPGLIGSIPDMLMIGRTTSSDREQLQRDRETILRLAPKGWTCKECHKDNQWRPLKSDSLSEATSSASAAPRPAPTPVPAKGVPEVIFQREERKAHPVESHIRVTKRIYSAESKEAAIEFLRTQKVSEPFYYVEVDTPAGRFGIDNGERIYDNKGRFIEAEPEPEKVAYDAGTEKMLSELERDRPNRRQAPPEIVSQGEAALRCLRVIIEDGSAEFNLRRLAVWWGSQFNNAGFNAFLRQRFVEGKDRVKLWQRADSSQSEIARAEAGLYTASTDVLSGSWKP